MGCSLLPSLYIFFFNFAFAYDRKKIIYSKKWNSEPGQDTRRQMHTPQQFFFGSYVTQTTVRVLRLWATLLAERVFHKFYFFNLHFVGISKIKFETNPRRAASQYPASVQSPFLWVQFFFFYFCIWQVNIHVIFFLSYARVKNFLESRYKKKHAESEKKKRGYFSMCSCRIIWVDLVEPARTKKKELKNWCRRYIGCCDADQLRAAGN